MFKLVRDNIPEIMAKEGQVCDVAVAQSDEFFLKLLNGKLVEEVNEYFSSLADADKALNELVDIMTVIGALAVATGHTQEEFQEAYAAKMKERGGFSKRLIGFFPDQAPAKQAQSEQEN